MGETNYAQYPSLRGRVVVVTGGASGIGEALVEAFAMQGATVAFLDIQDQAAEQLIRRLEGVGCVTPTYFRCDLTDVDALQAVMRGIVSQFGTVDVLVNNAGNDTRHSVADVTSASWDRGMAINLKAQFFTVQSVIPAMQKAKFGSIINMSSIGWVIPSINNPVYVTAKAAVVGMTRTLAHELGGDNIRVNSVMPGAIQTERQVRLWLTETYKTEILSRQALKRMILPEEVARLVLFLAADDSAAITNQSYVIDGGFV
ncbi:SDR family NAD(P)-dependent oxidoreductase [Granulicella sibirica]|uniref:3-oxoacyl-[acyl-carrier protein] reductase n=1 Tax=Granulicella sibirica TaxID=2479048 RepID=A0A4Q0T4L0_9BACT|nr:SDR family NAD(P)-dependent oxidoreductase [Granulicella sibirica]RXH56506.1 3-oxoacyl-[acyl-carrier protein] reductase [Granulicella sibirica]